MTEEVKVEIEAEEEVVTVTANPEITPVTSENFKQLLDSYYSKSNMKPVGAGCPSYANWFSVLCFWIFLIPFNLTMLLLNGFVDCFLRFTTTFIISSTRKNTPWYTFIPWLGYQIAGVVRLGRAGGSRFTLFSNFRKAFGNGDWWWMGEAAWNCPYKHVVETMKSEQKRRPAFGGSTTAVPELFPEKMILFESNWGKPGDPKDQNPWAVVRGSLEKNMTSRQAWAKRQPHLQKKLQGMMKKLNLENAKLEDLTKADTDKLVAFSTWYILLGVELTVDQIATVTEWGAKASSFILPRFFHMIAFNLLIGGVVALRKKTVQMLYDLKLFDPSEFDEDSKTGGFVGFNKINEECGQFAESNPVAMADAFMYAVIFAGNIGTAAGTWGVVQMLQKKTNDVPLDSVVFPKDDMKELYLEDRDGFLYESVRLDAPVTSATCCFKENKTVEMQLSCCGSNKSKVHVKDGMLHQYALSIANRDEEVFPDPKKFDSKRKDLANNILSWNGPPAAGIMNSQNFGTDENKSQFPRICPGMEVSKVVIQTICDYYVDKEAKKEIKEDLEKAEKLEKAVLESEL